MNGFFRAVVDQQRVNGPILVTHTKNDKAVGVAYPLASRINGDKTAAFGDENDVFGGLGRNGAQQMEAGETVTGRLLAADGRLCVPARRVLQPRGERIRQRAQRRHGKEVAHAIRQAIGA